MGFIRLIVIFFCIVLVMRFLRLYLLPFFMKKAGEKIFKDMENRMGGDSAKNDPRKEGEIRVEKTEVKQTNKVEEGEYVDYEEVP